MVRMGVSLAGGGASLRYARDNKRSQAAIRQLLGQIQQAKGAAVREAEHAAGEVVKEKVEAIRK
jgi:hypothetical protein